MNTISVAIDCGDTTCCGKTTRCQFLGSKRLGTMPVCLLFRDAYGYEQELDFDSNCRVLRCQACVVADTAESSVAYVVRPGLKPISVQEAVEVPPFDSDDMFELVPENMSAFRFDPEETL